MCKKARKDCRTPKKKNKEKMRRLFVLLCIKEETKRCLDPKSTVHNGGALLIDNTRLAENGMHVLLSLSRDISPAPFPKKKNVRAGW